MVLSKAEQGTGAGKKTTRMILAGCYSLDQKCAEAVSKRILYGWRRQESGRSVAQLLMDAGEREVGRRNEEIDQELAMQASRFRCRLISCFLQK